MNGLKKDINKIAVCSAFNSHTLFISTKNKYLALTMDKNNMLVHLLSYYYNKKLSYPIFYNMA